LFYSLAYCLTDKKRDGDTKNKLRKYLKEYYQSDEFDAIQVYTKITNFETSPALKSEFHSFLNLYKKNIKFINLLDYFHFAQTITDSIIKGLVLKPFTNMGIYYNTNTQSLDFDKEKIVLPVTHNLGKKQDIGYMLVQQIPEISFNEFVVDYNKIGDYRYGDSVIDFDNEVGKLINGEQLEHVNKELFNKIEDSEAYQKVLAECQTYYDNRNSNHCFLHFTPKGYRGGGLWVIGPIKRLPALIVMIKEKNSWHIF
jgi:hypothetical protein